VNQQEQSRWRAIISRTPAYVWIGGGFVLVLVLILVGYHYEITLWDWAELLFVPGVLALGGYLFTRSENHRTQRLADQRAQEDQDLANDRRKDEALQAYLDQMSQLLTDKERPLRRTQQGDNLSVVARARTLTVLQKLGPEHKRSTLHFLYESGLITRQLVVSLVDADLSGADLSEADLSEAYLVGAYLVGANLSRAYLLGAYLSGTNLSGADLSDANLSEAYLGGANVRAAYLRGTYLSRANLSGADLSGANLSEAYLGEADLSEAYLSGTNLSRANFSGANFSGAYLYGAVGVTNEQLEQASLLKGTTMPNGQKYEDWLNEKENRG
jgi:uncharacterized protein YjbI with pentapeptide repeats